jgi:hypothetical protein
MGENATDETNRNSKLVPVKLTNDVNRYSYKPYALFIPYLLANTFTLACLVVGMASYLRDGVLPGRKVQDIIYAAGGPVVQRRASLGSRKMSMCC